MSIVEAKRICTPADLLAMRDGNIHELVDGEIVEKPVGVLSNWVESLLHIRLGQFCLSNQLGPVFMGTIGLQCFPGYPMKVRKPDISFVRRERFDPKFLQDGFLTIAPDLAVEVVSPNDLVKDLNEKIGDYLAAGIALIWVIDPEAEIVVVYRLDGSVARLGKTDELSGENVIPGFRCTVADLFPPAYSPA